MKTIVALKWLGLSTLLGGSFAFAGVQIYQQLAPAPVQQWQAPAGNPHGLTDAEIAEIVRCPNPQQ